MMEYWWGYLGTIGTSWETAWWMKSWWFNQSFPIRSPKIAGEHPRSNWLFPARTIIWQRDPQTKGHFCRKNAWDMHGTCFFWLVQMKTSWPQSHWICPKETHAFRPWFFQQLQGFPRNSPAHPRRKCSWRSAGWLRQQCLENRWKNRRFLDVLVHVYPPKNGVFHGFCLIFP